MSNDDSSGKVQETRAYTAYTAMSISNRVASMKNLVGLMMTRTENSLNIESDSVSRQTGDRLL